jgi:uncharacterized protein (DUF3820 family)
MLLPMDLTEIDREDFRNLLVEIGLTRMPFGKFGKQAYPPHGVPLIDLPPEYLSWFQQRGFPKGRLGELMAHVCEIKDVGMDCVFDPIRQANGGRYPPTTSAPRPLNFDSPSENHVKARTDLQEVRWGQ